MKHGGFGMVRLEWIFYRALVVRYANDIAGFGIDDVCGDGGVFAGAADRDWCF